MLFMDNIEHIFLYLVLSLTTLGTVSLIKSIKFILHSRVLDGKIIKYEVGEFGTEISAKYPIIEYFDEELHKKFSFKSSFGLPYEKYKIGENVKIRLYKKKKRKSEIDNLIIIFLTPFILYVVSLGFIVVLLV